MISGFSAELYFPPNSFDEVLPPECDHMRRQGLPRGDSVKMRSLGCPHKKREFGNRRIEKEHGVKPQAEGDSNSYKSQQVKLLLLHPA